MMAGNSFWQPDRAWVNEINTTNLRTISGIRMATVVVGIGAAAFCWATYKALPWTLDPCPAMPCLEPLGRARAAEFAKSIYDSMCLFLAALMGIALGGYIGKRLTDTEHVERKEQAKKAPIVNVTSERPALQPPGVNITARDQATVGVDASPPPTEEHPVDGGTPVDGGR